MSSALPNQANPVSWLCEFVGRKRSAAAFLLILTLVAYFLLIGWAAVHPEQGDFAKFYSSGVALWEGGDPYQGASASHLGLEPGSPEASVVESGHPNLNPPLFVLVMSLLSVAPFSVAFWIWSTVSVLAGIWSARCLASELHLDMRAILLLLFCFFPTWVNVLYGQLALILLALLTLAWQLNRNEQDFASGLVLGLFSVLKLFGGLFLIPVLLRQQWKTLVGFAVGFLLPTGVSIAWYGLELTQNYSEALSTITWHAANWNASFAGLTSRFLGGSENTPLWDWPAAARVLSAAFTLGAGLLFLTQLRRVFPSRRLFVDCAYALTIPLALLISPLGWIYYFPLLLVGLFPLLARRPTGPGPLFITVGWLAAMIPSTFWKAVRVAPANLGFWTGLLYSLSLMLILLGVSLSFGGLRHRSSEEQI